MAPFSTSFWHAKLGKHTYTSGIGSDRPSPPPVWEFSPHNPVLFSERLVDAKYFEDSYRIYRAYELVLLS